MRRRKEQPHPFDHAAKEIFRLVPDLIARLVEFPIGERPLRFADSAVRSREHRADHVILVGEDGEPEAFGWHLEFQVGDDRREFLRWTLKNAALNEQLKRPIVLVIIYFKRGKAPDRFEIPGGGITNRHQFASIRLWEYADRILSGDLPELAPFLILWNHDRGVEALVEQRELLLRSRAPKDVIDDLLGWTVVLGNQFFPYEVLRSVFEKEIEMLKDFPEVKQWMEESRVEGGLQQARLICKRTLSERFGQLSPLAVEYLDLRTADELGELVVRSLRASDLSSLGIPG